MNYLEQIASLLPKEDLSKLTDIKEELHDAWHKKQIFRTETEARFGVLNDFKYPTKAAKYWQSVREQMAHFEQLVTASFELRRKKIDLNEVQDKLKEVTGYEAQRLEIERDELIYIIAGIESTARDRAREVMQWSMLKKEVNDGSFDDKDVNTHQRESLFKSVVNRASTGVTDMSTEEKLSINGLLFGLSKEDVNKELSEQLKLNKKK